MSMLQEDIEYTFNIHKLYLNLNNQVTGFDYELRMFLGEEATETEVTSGQYVFLSPVEKSEDIMSSIIQGIKNDQNIDDIENFSVFVSLSNLLKSRKTLSCSLSLTNIV